MVEKIDFKPAEKAFENTGALLSKIQESKFWWPDRKTFEIDIATASELLSEMQQALSALIIQLSERTDVIYGQGLESEVSEAIHKSYNILSKLYDDLHVIKADGPVRTDSKEIFGEVKIHFQQIKSHYTATRDRLMDLEQEFVIAG